jgi:hypothetical protein
MVAYAVEAPSAPRIAMRVAMVRCAGDTWGVGAVGTPYKLTASATGTGSPDMGSTGGVGNNHGGRATHRTPANASKPAIASFVVYGSLNQMKQTIAVMVGMMNVMTVASEMLSHDNESE